MYTFNSIEYLQLCPFDFSNREGQKALTIATELHEANMY